MNVRSVRYLSKDEGFTMPLVVLLSFIVMMLIGVVLTVTVADTQQSAAQRFRSESRYTTESGLDEFYSNVAADPYYLPSGAYLNHPAVWTVDNPDKWARLDPATGRLVPCTTAPYNGCFQLKVAFNDTGLQGVADQPGDGYAVIVESVSRTQCNTLFGRAAATASGCVETRMQMVLRRPVLTDYLHFTNSEVLDRGADVLNFGSPSLGFRFLTPFMFNAANPNGAWVPCDGESGNPAPTDPRCRVRAAWQGVWDTTSNRGDTVRGDVIRGPLFTNELQGIVVCRDPWFSAPVRIAGPVGFVRADQAFGDTQCAPTRIAAMSNPALAWGQTPRLSTDPVRPVRPLWVPTGSQVEESAASAPGGLLINATGLVSITLNGTTLSYTANGQTFTNVPLPVSGSVYVKGASTVRLGTPNGTDTLDGRLSIATDGQMHIVGNIVYQCAAGLLGNEESNPTDSAPLDILRPDRCGTRDEDLLGLTAQRIFIDPDPDRDNVLETRVVHGTLLAIGQPTTGSPTNACQIRPLNEQTCQGSVSVIGFRKGVTNPDDPPRMVLFGAIAGVNRGVYGNYNPDNGQLVAGLAKDWNYDIRLRNEQPPFFLAPTSTTWERVDTVEVRNGIAAVAAPGEPGNPGSPGTPTNPNPGAPPIGIIDPGPGSVVRVPGAPSRPNVSPGNQQITVIWNPPGDNGGAPILSYDVEVVAFGGGAPSGVNGPTIRNVPAGPATNLLAGNQSTFESGTTIVGWTGTNATLAVSTNAALSGTNLMQATSSAAGPSMTVNSTVVNVTAGQAVFAEAFVRAGNRTNRNVTLAVVWLNEADQQIGTSNLQVGSLTNTWRSLNGIAVAPEGTARARLSLIYTHASGSQIAAGETFHVDDVTFTRVPSFTFLELTNGIPYQFRVRANNLRGNGAWSELSEPATPFTVPGVVARPTATAEGAGQLTIRWPELTDTGGLQITGYEVSVYEPDGITPAAGVPDAAGRVQPAQPGTNTMVWNGLPGGRVFTFRVRAISSAGASPNYSLASEPVRTWSPYHELVVGTSGLMSYLRFGETGNTSPDISGNNRDWTQVAGTTGNGSSFSPLTAENWNGSRLLSGSPGNPSFGQVNNLTSLPSTFTIEGWFLLDADASSTWQNVFIKGDDGSTRQLGVFLHPDGYLHTSVVNSSGTNNWANTPTGLISTTPTWQHIAVTWDGTTVRTWVNGVEHTAITGSVNPDTAANTRPLYVGYLPGAGGNPTNGWYPLAGAVDELAVYNRALTETELRARFTTAGYTYPTSPSNAMNPTSEFVASGQLSVSWTPLGGASSYLVVPVNQAGTLASGSVHTASPATRTGLGTDAWSARVYPRDTAGRVTGTFAQSAQTLNIPALSGIGLHWADGFWNRSNAVYATVGTVATAGSYQLNVQNMTGTNLGAGVWTRDNPALFNSSQLSVTGLPWNTEYRVRARACTGPGGTGTCGAWGPWVQAANTDERRTPPDMPANLTNENIPGFRTVGFSAPASGGADAYVISWYNAGGSWLYDTIGPPWGPGANYNTDINATQVRVRSCRVNTVAAERCGPMSPPISLTMRAPSVPTNLRITGTGVNSVGNTWVDVAWDAPPGRVTQYQVGNGSNVVCTTTATSCRINGLTGNSPYQVNVWAGNEGGGSGWSALLPTFTAADGNGWYAEFYSGTRHDNLLGSFSTYGTGGRWYWGTGPNQVGSLDNWSAVFRAKFAARDTGCYQWRVNNDDEGALWIANGGWILGWGTGNRQWLGCNWLTAGQRQDTEMQFAEWAGSAEFNVYFSTNGGASWTLIPQGQLYPWPR